MSPPRILIVEDEGIVVLEIRQRLGRLGYEVAGVADSAGEAVRLAEELRPDLVLMDIRLREDDGVEAAGEIVRRGGAPVVFLTAHADEATLRRAGEAGPSGYLLKPFQEQDLQVAIEIALRKHRVEKELRQNERRFATTLASIADGVIAADSQGRITYLNPVAESLTGWSAEEARDRPFAELIQLTERAGATVDDPVARVLQSREPIHLHDTLLTARDGRRILIDDSVAPIHEDGEFVGVVFVFRDVGGRRRAEEQLHIAQRALESASQGILITGPVEQDTPILSVNGAFERITGYRRQEVLGKNCRLLQGPGTDPQAVRALREAIREGRPIDQEILNYRRDGTPFWNALTVSPIHDEAGRVTHFVGVLRDVTREKELEEQAREAQRLDAIGQLAGGVAHDFNNLLTVISGYLGLLRGVLTTGGEGALAYLEPIDQAQQRAAALTRQLLAFGRRQLLRPTLLDLNEVVRSLTPRLDEILGDGVERVLDLAPDSLTVKVDREQLEHVLRDLTANAREAMTPETGEGAAAGRLTLTTRVVVVGEGEDIPPGRYHVVSVADTGRGMDEATRARVFEPFFTTKQVGKGSGLGLASAYGAMKQSGGHIRVESAPGRGSTFTLYFLLAPPATSGPGEWAAGAAQTDLPPGSETVLLVEDEWVVRALVGQVLRMSGYTVLEADDGIEALKVLERHSGPLHLLISDVLMPKINGPELARRVAKRRPGLRVLFLSGYPEGELVDLDLLHVGQPLLTKPFTPADLAHKVREVLDATPTGKGG
jgi:two-component system cell cycle sensor histidine kinase/response regulator CckA